MKYLLFVYLFFSINAIAAYDCSNEGYVISFFNGVWNTRDDAEKNSKKLKEHLNLADEFKDQTVDYELFYNQTGKGSKNATLMQDIAEVFMMRAKELDANLGERWELFWEALSSPQKNSGIVKNPIEYLKNLSTKTQALFKSLDETLLNKGVGYISSLVSNPLTEVDLKNHVTRIKTLALEGKKLFLVAHSQGNLFANGTYKFASTIDGYDKSSIGVYHIAPPISTLYGNYILGDLDLIINGLRVLGSNTIPETNFNIPVKHLLDDPSGHTLIGTYLDKSLLAGIIIKQQIIDDLKLLKEPNTQGNSGYFTVTMTWDGTGDIDLHIFEPNNNHVYYGAKEGAYGYLDVDNRSAYGPEHYYTKCENSEMLLGTYSFGINNYEHGEGRTATLQVSSIKDGVIFTKILSVGPENGHHTEVGKITVFKDADDQIKISF